MFSICTKGIEDSLNRTPGGAAKFASLSFNSIQSARKIRGLLLICTYLHKAIPSLRASRRSPPASRSPKAPSIHARISLAACGVYLDRRNFRTSLSREDTDAIMLSERRSTQEMPWKWRKCSEWNRCRASQVGCNTTSRARRRS